MVTISVAVWLPPALQFSLAGGPQTKILVSTIFSFDRGDWSTEVPNFKNPPKTCLFDVFLWFFQHKFQHYIQMISISGHCLCIIFKIYQTVADIRNMTSQFHEFLDQFLAGFCHLVLPCGGQLVMNQRILLPPAPSPLPPPSFLQKKTIKFLISSWQTNKVGRISGWLKGSFLSSGRVKLCTLTFGPQRV